MKNKNYISRTHYQNTGVLIQNMLSALENIGGIKQNTKDATFVPIDIMLESGWWCYPTFNSNIKSPSDHIDVSIEEV